MSTIAGDVTRRREATVARVSATETKHSTKTTEFYAMIGVIAGILIAAWYVGRDGGVDSFRANDAWPRVATGGACSESGLRGPTACTRGRTTRSRKRRTGRGGIEARCESKAATGRSRIKHVHQRSVPASHSPGV
jgi:hypothetical protein